MLCPCDQLSNPDLLRMIGPLMALNHPTSFYIHLLLAMDFEHQQEFFGSKV